MIKIYFSNVFFLGLISFLPTLGYAIISSKLNPSINLNKKSINKIVLNGEKVSPIHSLWKNSVYLKINDSYCGGIIIQNRFILTAAHCVTNTNANDIEVFFGFSSNHHQSQIPTVKVKKIISKQEFSYLFSSKNNLVPMPKSGLIEHNQDEYLRTQNRLNNQQGVMVYDFPFTYEELLEAFDNRHNAKTQQSLYNMGDTLGLYSGYDLALLFLETKIPEGYYPVDLLPDHILESELSRKTNMSFPKFIITGYGLEKRSFKDYKPDLRFYSNDLVQAMKLQNKYVIFQTDSRLSPDDGRSCFGDSGSGIYYTYKNKHYLIGLISAGYNSCAGLTLSPSINFHKEWIYKNINLENKFSDQQL